MNLSQVVVRPIEPTEESKFQELMRQHQYLGDLQKIGNTIWYIGISSPATMNGSASSAFPLQL